MQSVRNYCYVLVNCSQVNHVGLIVMLRPAINEQDVDISIELASYVCIFQLFLSLSN